jgi:uncharacterized protein YciI
MPHFVLTCLDRPGALDVRLANRPDHVAYLESQASVLRLAGPFLDDAGSPIGSMLIVETGDHEGAAAFAAEDPFAKAGLFESVTIRPWRLTMGALG